MSGWALAFAIGISVWGLGNLAGALILLYLHSKGR